MAEPHRSSSLRDWLSPVIFYSNNWISRLGVALTTAATVFWLFLLPSFLTGEAASAYMGILIFMALPAVFFTGLALIPAGIAMRKRREKRRGAAAINPDASQPLFSWANAAFRRLVLFTGFVTVANVAIGASFAYRAVHHMESVQFCGATCHTVMKPEYTAYQNSPHSKVACVQCHIGPGANWFVKSKLSGSWQVISVLFRLYERPIPTPVANLRPARDTCEGCHWPDKYGGDRLRIIPHFNDEGAMSRTVLLMRIGGGSASGRKGIHGAHVGQGIRIRYGHTDYKREKIPWVEYQRDGEIRQFFADGVTPEDVSRLSIREMDCIDCHTRPSHTFELPERALDNAMAAGEVEPTLPGMRSVALAVLKRDYGDTAKAEAAIPAAIVSHFRENKPDLFPARQADVERSARGVLAIWRRNVFPEMRVSWGTYPNHIGHNDFPGCFRCHDGERKTKDGKAIEQDCNSCHVMLAVEEEKPKILSDLGLVSEN